MVVAPHPPGPSMTLVQLETILAERLGMAPEDASRAVRGVLALVAETLAAGGEVKLSGFGRFGVRERLPRRHKDPRNGRDLDVPSRRRAVFKASRVLAARIEGARPEHSRSTTVQGAGIRPPGHRIVRGGSVGRLEPTVQAPGEGGAIDLASMRREQ